MLIIGIICREKKLIRPEGIEGLQALVMNFTLPISLFYTFYRASIKADTVIFPVTFFIVTAGGIFAGRLLCKLVKEKDVYFPFTLTGYEAGMLGYALFGILLGNDKITQFALMDIGHVLAIFTVYVAMVKKCRWKPSDGRRSDKRNSVNTGAYWNYVRSYSQHDRYWRLD